jgi:hypothetical protein
MAENPSLRKRPRGFHIAIVIGAIIGTAIGMGIKGEMFSLTSFVGAALGLGLGIAIHSAFIADQADERSSSASSKDPGSSESA